MSKNLSKLMKLRKQESKEDKPELSEQEQKALDKIRKEAKEHGATLHSNGEGGLPPSLVLGTFRRDEWKCKKCGSQKDLTMHHKGHLQNPKSTWLKKKAHSNDENNIVTFCAACHDDVHQEDKEGAK